MFWHPSHAASGVPDRDPIKCIAAAIKQGLGAQGCRIPAQAVQDHIGTTNRMLVADRP